jgi:hypothetical protein
MQLDDRALMVLDAEILFTYDVRGRMLRVNEPDGRRAPRLFVGRTTGGHVIRFGELVPDAVADRLLEIVEAQPPADSLRLPPALRESIRATLEQDGPIGSEGGGPAYRFPGTVTPRGDAVEVTDANRERVRDALPWLYRELGGRGPCLAVLVNDAAAGLQRIGEQLRRLQQLTRFQIRETPIGPALDLDRSADIPDPPA